MNEKMTYGKALAFVLDNCNGLPEEVVEKLEALREQTSKTHTSTNKPTKAQVENVELANKLYELMLTRADEKHTVSEWMNLDETFGALANQKVSALMRMLEKEGKVAKTSEKRKSYFEAKAVEDEGD